MAKRSKRIVPALQDLSKPSRWRLQYGGFSEPVREADPETGTPVQHRRAVDSIAAMLANGTITTEMHEAGCIFRTLFRSAALDGIATTQFVRLGGVSADTMSVRQIDARRRVARAIDALGGHDSPAGSAVWFVVGLEMSIREWSARQGLERQASTAAHRRRHARRRPRDPGDAFRADAPSAGGVKLHGRGGRRRPDRAVTIHPMAARKSSWVWWGRVEKVRRLPDRHRTRAPDVGVAVTIHPVAACKSSRL